MARPDPLVILHLSDLHFGVQSRFEGLDAGRLGRQLIEDIVAARTRLGVGGPLALVVVTGDVASLALPGVLSACPSGSSAYPSTRPASRLSLGKASFRKRSRGGWQRGGGV